MAYKKLDMGEPQNVRQLSQYIAQEFDRVAHFLRAAQGAATILQDVAGAQWAPPCPIAGYGYGAPVCTW